jgi:hypothetical protein
MKKLLLLSLTFWFLSLGSIKAQGWEWAINYDNGWDGEADNERSLGLDKKDNIYVIGSDHSSSAGEPPLWSYNELLYKFDATGNLIWKDTLQIGAARHTTDPDGNTYVAGANGVAKYDSLGQLVWIQIIPYCGLKDLALHPNGDMVVVGVHNAHSLSLGNITVPGNANCFIARCDKDGNWLWAREEDDFGGKSVVIGSDNYIYSTGSGTDSVTGVPFHIRKYDSNGVPVIRMAEGINNNPNDISLDEYGNIYIIGFVSDNQPLILNGDSIVPAGGDGEYIVKYDANGNLLWYKTFSCYAMSLSTVLTDEDNNVYVSGYFHSSLDVDNIHLDSYGAEVFVVKIAPGGNIIWLKSSQVQTPYGGYAYSINMALTSGNDIVVAGSVSKQVAFDNSVVYAGITGYPDLLIAKMKNSTVGTEEIVLDQNLLVYPNPTSGAFDVIYSGQEKELRLEVTNSLGQSVFAKEYDSAQSLSRESIDLSTQAKGIYFLEVVSGERREVRKIIVQ